MSPPGGLFTNREMMSYLKISRATLYRLLATGMPSLGRGRLRRFNPEVVARWYLERAGKRTPPRVPGSYRCPKCGGWWMTARQVECACGGTRILVKSLETMERPGTLRSTSSRTGTL
jgi:excisionase family DNA binding protein